MLFNLSMILPSEQHKNLKGIYFDEKHKVECIIDMLLLSAQDVYTISMPLIASAQLSDEIRYLTARSHMLNAIKKLDREPNSAPTWMQNNGFKSWMWGRVLLAGYAMDDMPLIKQALSQYDILLEKNNDNQYLAFFTWALAYRAAFNQSEYHACKKSMLANSLTLANNAHVTHDHEIISNALWVWVMALQAAACAFDKETYHWIKEKITLLDKEDTISKTLEKNLLRNTKSNDFPAWAMAKVRYAAALINDRELYQEIEKTLTSSTYAAQNTNASAEYALAVLDNQLAIHIAQDNQNKLNFTPSLFC